MTDIYTETRNEASQYAIDNDITTLVACAYEPDRVWKYLDFFVSYSEKTGEKTEKGKDKFAYPYHVRFKSWGKTYPKKATASDSADKAKINASYVSNTKTAIARVKALKKSLAKNDQDEIYNEYQTAELEILNAYGLRVLLDLVKSDPNIFKGIDAKIDKWIEEKKNKE